MKIGPALGLVYVGHRAGDLSDSFLLPSYRRWDGGLFIERGKLSFSLYAENLFDVQYFTGSVSSVQVAPGAPANLRASVRVAY